MKKTKPFKIKTPEEQIRNRIKFLRNALAGTIRNLREKHSKKFEKQSFYNDRIQFFNGRIEDIEDRIANESDVKYGGWEWRQNPRKLNAVFQRMENETQLLRVSIQTYRKMMEKVLIPYERDCTAVQGITGRMIVELTEQLDNLQKTV